MALRQQDSALLYLRVISFDQLRGAHHMGRWIDHAAACTGAFDARAWDWIGSSAIDRDIEQPLVDNLLGTGRGSCRGPIRETPIGAFGVGDLGTALDRRIRELSWRTLS